MHIFGAAVAVAAALLRPPPVIAWERINRIPRHELRGIYKALSGKTAPRGADDQAVKSAIARQCELQQVRILPPPEPCGEDF